MDELMKQIDDYIGLLQPGTLQFEIEKAESCRIQNPALHRAPEKAFYECPRFGGQFKSVSMFSGPPSFNIDGQVLSFLPPDSKGWEEAAFGRGA